MNIKEKLDDIIDQVEADPNGALADNLMNKAIAAILGGPNSADWKAYMGFFADTPQELDRLTLKDAAATDPWVKKQVVYMVSYAVCGAITITNTRVVVTSEVIDQ
jgi:hypothetical protein